MGRRRNAATLVLVLVLAAWLTVLHPSAASAAPTYTVTELTAGLPVGSRPLDIINGPDGAVWFSDNAGFIGSVSATGAITEFPTGANGGASLAIGPDGKVWFVDGQNRVGRISSAGAITYIAQVSGNISGMVTGADGNLWLSHIVVQSGITRVTPGGQVTEFGPDLGWVLGITAGPDGNVWFARNTGGSIDKITPDGTIIEVVGGLNRPSRVTVGADNAIWFAADDESRFGRIGPGGQVTYFSQGLSPNPGITGLALGPDGAIWFTEQTANRVGRVTTSGEITELEGVSPGSIPLFITGGTNGDVWFAEWGSGDRGAIGRVSGLEVDASARAPFGNIDTATPAVGGVSLTGWAIDPDSPGSISTSVFVDGVERGAAPADLDRFDVRSVFPRFGSKHGFARVVPATPGTHRVCVYGNNVGPGPLSALLGCRVSTVPGGDPFGAFDALTGAAGIVTATGWAIDPDVVASISVAVYVDGAKRGEFAATDSRLDVAAAFPGYGSPHGYSVTVPASAGSHTVCVYAINVATGTQNTTLGCRGTVVPSGDPFGAFDALTGAAGTVTATGWAIDPDVAASISVAVYVDGAKRGEFAATDSRPDVAAAFPGYGSPHGYGVTVPASAGAHTVCVYAINVATGTQNTTLGCRSAIAT